MNAQRLLLPRRWIISLCLASGRHLAISHCLPILPCSAIFYAFYAPLWPSHRCLHALFWDMFLKRYWLTILFKLWRRNIWYSFLHKQIFVKIQRMMRAVLRTEAVYIFDHPIKTLQVYTSLKFLEMFFLETRNIIWWSIYILKLLIILINQFKSKWIYNFSK